MSIPSVLCQWWSLLRFITVVIMWNHLSVWIMRRDFKQNEKYNTNRFLNTNTVPTIQNLTLAKHLLLIWGNSRHLKEDIRHLILLVRGLKSEILPTMKIPGLNSRSIPGATLPFFWSNARSWRLLLLSPLALYPQLPLNPGTMYSGLWQANHRLISALT